MHRYRGMYDLPQAGKLANDCVQSFLAPYGYAPTNFTAGLWKHETRPVAFTLFLVVNNFGIEYTQQRRC